MDDGYTRVPNYLLAVLYGSRLKGSEAAVFAFIIRKTCGFHKKTDRLSYTQIADATGFHRDVVIRAVKSLEKKKLIKVSRKGNKVNLITVCGSKSTTTDSSKTVGKLVVKSLPTKETQKETAAGFRLGDSTLAAKEEDIEEVYNNLGEEYE